VTQEQGKYVRWFENLDSDDVSLGEMLQALKEEGVRVPDGFTTTADAYWAFLEANDLQEEIRARLEDLKSGNASLQETGKGIRRMFRYASFPQEIADRIVDAYHELGKRYDVKEVEVAGCQSRAIERLNKGEGKWQWSIAGHLRDRCLPLKESRNGGVDEEDDPGCRRSRQTGAGPRRL
jgi:phosphoenolpyruvate synthase/pyruvate phosphate dikinase